jgi:hypothetical protein
MMAAPAQFDSAIPRRIILTVDVPERLSQRSIEGTVGMFDARLRFLLAQRYKQQARERTIARITAQDARKAARAAALDAAAREAEAQEAVADGRKSCATTLFIGSARTFADEGLGLGPSV